MKALTIRQPHATLIALGVKHIETRSSPTTYRGPLAIHAGKAPLPLGGISIGGWLAFNSITDPAYQGPRVVNPVTRRTSHVPSRAQTPTLLWPRQGPHARLREDNPEWSYREYLPLGAIVATCKLVDCVPITDRRHMPDRGAQLTINPATGTLYLLGSALSGDMTNVSNQLPYGDFTPGRWAWLLADIVPCDPIPAKGAQGLWTWQP